MSSDSWMAFAEALRQEAELLARVDASALALTTALVHNDIRQIEAANTQLERDRIAHHGATRARQTMQRRGFGDMPLQRVVSYAPRKLALRLRGYCSELTYRAISLGITTKNNKTLITSGMDRLLKVVMLLQRSVADNPRTYKRRGFIPAPDNSILVSSKA
jgi:GNAT superfamily N-acetyltransferase